MEPKICQIYICDILLITKELYIELKLKETGEILGLRETGARLRTLVEEALENNESILLDFESVESVSSSFADEFIAKLFVKIGSEKFLEHIKLKNVNDFIKVIINTTLKDRLTTNN